MAEQRRRLARLAVLEELRASYGIKVKSGSCLAAAKHPGAAAAEVRGGGGCRCGSRACAEPGAGPVSRRRPGGVTVTLLLAPGWAQPPLAGKPLNPCSGERRVSPLFLSEQALQAVVGIAIS